MTDEEIEEMITDLIEHHAPDDAARELALDWLKERAIAYQAIKGLGLLDDE